MDDPPESDPDALARRFVLLGPGHLQQLVRRVGGQRSAARCMGVSQPLLHRWIHDGAILDGWAGYPRLWRRLDALLGRPVLDHPGIDRDAWASCPLEVADLLPTSRPRLPRGMPSMVPWPDSVAALDRLAIAVVGVDWVDLVRQDENPGRRSLPSGAVQALLRVGLVGCF